MDLVAVILFFWSRWLAKQRGAPPWLRFVPWALVVTFFGSLLGTVGGLWLAFKSVENVSPADKATLLAERISMAMRFTAGAIAFDLIVLVMLIILTVTTRAQRTQGT